MTPPGSPVIRRFLAFTRLAGLAAMVAGGLVLAGWLLDLDSLKSVLVGAASMKPNTAVCFILAGAALRLSEVLPERPAAAGRRRRLAARVAGGLVALVGFLTLGEEILGTNLGIDDLLFRQALAATGDLHPGRMASGTALAFLTLGMSLLLLDLETRRGYRPSQYLALATGLIGFIACLGYLYGVRALYSFYAYSSTALHTAFLFVVTAAAALCARPDRGLMATLTSVHMGGLLSRRILPAAVLVPIAVGWLRLTGERAGLYGAGFGLALFAASNVVIFAIVVWLGARFLNRVDGQRHGAETALRNTEIRFRALIERGSDGIVLSDGRNAILYASPAVTAIEGCSPEELLGRSGYDRVHPDDRGALEEIFGQALAKPGVPIPHQWRQGHKDGGWRWVEGVTTNLLHDSAVRAVVTNYRDVTARRTAEEARHRLEIQLRQSQKMEALGTLASGIAHDFNNLLTTMVGNAKLLREELPAGHASQQSLGEIYKAGVRATELVRRILAFGRRQEARRRIAALRPIVEEALTLLRSTLPAMIEIRTDFAPELPSVSIDATQIHQVILNLGTNAAHAMAEKGGRLTVRAEAVTVGADLARSSAQLHEGRYVRLTVSDDGCGIDKGLLPRIFEPFFTTKGPGEGTGLGLSVVHGILETHEGAISVYSEPGKGTTFQLYFPAAGREAEETEPQGREAPRGRGERVLYVDDDESIVLLITRVLKRLGYAVTGHTDAEKALQAFRERPRDFDAVVTDLSMPGMSGTDLARRLLAIRPDIPIVMTSGYVRQETIEAARGIGVRDVLQKPDTIDALGRTLHDLLSRRARGGPD